MKTNKIIIIILFLIGFIVLLLLIINNSKYQSNLIEINSASSINLNVNDAYNERGIYILNNKFYIGDNSIIKINLNNINIKDDALWRPKNSKFVPKLSDIKSPFYIFKNKKSDSIFLVKNKDTIILLLNN